MIKKIIENLEKAKGLVLDFDGTLVDSNPIKLGAFEKCFAEYPQHFETIMAYCKGNNHIPRQVKFKFVFENILKIPYTAKIEKTMLDRYATETTEQVIAAPEIPGALKFLERFALNRETALLSSTPHETLLYILARRNWTRYFKEIRGAPVEKAVWVGEFLQNQHLKKEEILFIGDSSEDAAAAAKAQVPFISVGPTSFTNSLHHIRDFD
ncbi:MAG: HAD hydrolase-like protein [Deltaproteobacteria bacterium]|nr:HAD hydrolase-like protein [Deltaproteobacteria bacterium]